MKLRILGDSVRLRLSKSDVDTLRETGRVAETVHFGAGAAAALTYALQLGDDVGEVTARLDGTQMTVTMPRARGLAWANGTDVGISAEQSLPGEAALALLIEKDFKCLAPREGEEDYDGFDNPDVGAKTC